MKISYPMLFSSLRSLLMRGFWHGSSCVGDTLRQRSAVKVAGEPNLVMAAGLLTGDVVGQGGGAHELVSCAVYPGSGLQNRRGSAGIPVNCYGFSSWAVWVKRAPGATGSHRGARMRSLDQLLDLTS